MASYNPKEVAQAIISSPNLTEASARLGISRNTLLNVRKDKRTKHALKRLAKELYEESINRAMVAQGESIDILQRLARGEFSDSQSAWIQINACKQLQDVAKYGADVQTLEERLEKIERLLDEETT